MSTEIAMSRTTVATELTLKNITTIGASQLSIKISYFRPVSSLELAIKYSNAR